MIRPGFLVRAHHNYLNYRLDLNGYLWWRFGLGLWSRLDELGKMSPDKFYKAVNKTGRL